MSLAITIMILFSIAIILVLLIAGSKAKYEGGEEMIKNVYVYLVLFATLMMIIGGSVSVFMAAADIIAPTPYHQTFEEYKKMDSKFLNKDMTNETKLTEEQLRENYEAMIESYKNNQIQRAKNTLIKSLGWIIIPLPIFIYFQRRVARKDL